MILALILFACGEKTETKAPEPVTSENTTENTVEKASVKSTPAGKKEGKVLLDGVEKTVFWDDGDTFAFTGEDGKKVKARLNGLNTLESYGPVHQWGSWTEAELYTLAKECAGFAAAEKWTCIDTQKGGGYGRILVDCPDFRKAILEAGLAHPFSVDTPAPEEDISAMNIAIEGKKGIWAKGVPKHLITSLHSQDEKEDQDAYNRICVTETGQCDAVTHTETYGVCQKVCHDDSCMTYVPYKQRYGNNAADCLKIE